MKRKMYVGIFILGLFCLMSISFVTYARSNSITKSYGGVDLICTITCTNTYGYGSTNGANFDGYRNYIKVVTYNINQVAIGAKEAVSIDKAYAKVSKGNPYMTRTFHAATDKDGNQLLPAYQQIQQTQGRD